MAEMPRKIRKENEMVTNFMTDKKIKEDIKYLKQCKKLQSSIVTHNKYEYFSNHLRDWELSILRIVGNCNFYKDLPNFNVLQMLEQIKKGC